MLNSLNIMSVFNFWSVDNDKAGRGRDAPLIDNY